MAAAPPDKPEGEEAYNRLLFLVETKEIKSREDLLAKIQATKGLTQPHRVALFKAYNRINPQDKDTDPKTPPAKIKDALQWILDNQGQTIVDEVKGYLQKAGLTVEEIQILLEARRQFMPRWMVPGDPTAFKAAEQKKFEAFLRKMITGTVPTQKEIESTLATAVFGEEMVKNLLAVRKLLFPSHEEKDEKAPSSSSPPPSSSKDKDDSKAGSPSPPSSSSSSKGKDSKASEVKDKDKPPAESKGKKDDKPPAKSVSGKDEKEKPKHMSLNSIYERAVKLVDSLLRHNDLPGKLALCTIWNPAFELVAFHALSETEKAEIKKHPMWKEFKVLEDIVLIGQPGKWDAVTRFREKWKNAIMENWSEADFDNIKKYRDNPRLIIQIIVEKWITYLQLNKRKSDGKVDRSAMAPWGILAMAYMQEVLECFPDVKAKLVTTMHDLLRKDNARQIICPGYIPKPGEPIHDEDEGDPSKAKPVMLDRIQLFVWDEEWDFLLEITKPPATPPPPPPGGKGDTDMDEDEDVLAPQGNSGPSREELRTQHYKRILKTLQDDTTASITDEELETLLKETGSGEDALLSDLQKESLRQVHRDRKAAAKERDMANLGTYSEVLEDLLIALIHPAVTSKQIALSILAKTQTRYPQFAESLGNASRVLWILRNFDSSSTRDSNPADEKKATEPQPVAEAPKKASEDSAAVQDLTKFVEKSFESRENILNAFKRIEQDLKERKMTPRELAESFRFQEALASRVQLELMEIYVDTYGASESHKWVLQRRSAKHPPITLKRLSLLRQLCARYMLLPDEWEALIKHAMISNDTEQEFKARTGRNPPEGFQPRVLDALLQLERTEPYPFTPLAYRPRFEFKEPADKKVPKKYTLETLREFMRLASGYKAGDTVVPRWSWFRIEVLLARFAQEIDIDFLRGHEEYQEFLIRHLQQFAPRADQRTLDDEISRMVDLGLSKTNAKYIKFPYVQNPTAEQQKQLDQLAMIRAFIRNSLFRRNLTTTSLGEFLDKNKIPRSVITDTNDEDLFSMLQYLHSGALEAESSNKDEEGDEKMKDKEQKDEKDGKDVKMKDKEEKDEKDGKESKSGKDEKEEKKGGPPGGPAVDVLPPPPPGSQMDHLLRFLHGYQPTSASRTGTRITGENAKPFKDVVAAISALDAFKSVEVKIAPTPVDVAAWFIIVPATNVQQMGLNSAGFPYIVQSTAQDVKTTDRVSIVLKLDVTARPILNINCDFVTGMSVLAKEQKILDEAKQSLAAIVFTGSILHSGILFDPSSFRSPDQIAPRPSAATKPAAATTTGAPAKGDVFGDVLSNLRSKYPKLTFTSERKPNVLLTNLADGSPTISTSKAKAGLQFWQYQSSHYHPLLLVSGDSPIQPLLSDALVTDNFAALLALDSASAQMRSYVFMPFAFKLVTDGKIVEDAHSASYTTPTATLAHTFGSKRVI